MKFLKLLFAAAMLLSFSSCYKDPCGTYKAGPVVLAKYYYNLNGAQVPEYLVARFRVREIQSENAMAPHELYLYADKQSTIFEFTNDSLGTKDTLILGQYKASTFTDRKCGCQIKTEAAKVEKSTFKQTQYTSTHLLIYL